MRNGFFTIIITEWLDSKLNIFILRTFRGEAFWVCEQAHEKGQLGRTMKKSQTAHSAILFRLLPQTQFCAEVKMVNMGTKQSSLNIHILSVGIWLFSKPCQMEKGRKQGYYEYMFYLC